MSFYSATKSVSSQRSGLPVPGPGYSAVTDVNPAAQSCRPRAGDLGDDAPRFAGLGSAGYRKCQQPTGMASF